MATISLYAGKINQMPGLIKAAKNSVETFKSELSSLQKKASKVDRGVCDLSEVISAIQASTQTQENRIEALENFRTKSEEFINDTVRIDNKVAETVNQNKEDFYDKYDYLKPDCEKSGWEKFCDACEKVGEWCKEHWKLIVTVVIVVVSVVLLCTGVGGILGAAALGALMGAAIGGVSGGLESMANGGSFWEGFEEGAFSGAISGAIMGGAMAGLGALGATLGKGISCLSKLGKFIKITATVTKTISTVMGGFDTLAMMDKTFGLFGGNLADFNAMLHSSTAYNVFQIGVTALAAFTGGMTSTMSCFVAGTLVLTASGLVAIENIKAGDKVISTNPETGVTEEKTVLEAFHKNASELVHMKIGSDVITTTHDHPFFVVGKGFVKAGRLRLNDELLDNNRNKLKISKILFESVEESTTVYNLKVQDYHTYFVGKNSIYVHNLDCGKTSTAFDQDEFASTKEERVARTPSDDNQNVSFTGDRGNSKCVPNDPNSSLAKTLNDCGVDGIEYKNGVPDFSPTSRGEVQIDHMNGGSGKMGTMARNSNFSQADNAMAVELNADPAAAKSLGITPKNGSTFTKTDVTNYRKANNLTWHELNDTRTMQLVPTEVNGKFTHLGGVGEINAGAYEPGGFAFH